MKEIDAILYTSDTGFTARYANLLGERTKLPVFDIKGRQLPPRGARVAYLGWLRAGEVRELKKARRDWDVKCVCAVGMAPENSLETIMQANRITCPLFYVQGGYAPEKLKGVSKVMMWMFTKMMTGKPPKDESEAGMQQALRAGCDCVDEKNLAPLLAWLSEQA